MKKSEFIERLEELEKKVEALEARKINPLDKYFPVEPYRPWRHPWTIEPFPGPSWPTNPWENPWTTTPGITWCGSDTNGTVTTTGDGNDIGNVGLY